LARSIIVTGFGILGHAVAAAFALADVILFLASPAARAISGALIPVTRGG